MYDNMTPVIRSLSNTLNMTLTIFENMKSSVREGLDATTIRAARDELAKATGAMENLKEAAEKVDANIKQGTGSTFKLGQQLKSLAGGFVGLMGAKKLIEIADFTTLTTSRLNLMNDGLQTTAELQQKIMESANRSRASFRTTADMVSKLGMQAGKAFGSNEELIRFSELLNKTFVIAGTDAQGVASTMYNLTQALSSGVLRGQDLNAVMSNAMPIVQNIADYLQVDVGKIRELAAAGELSAKVIKDAMFFAAQKTEEQFANIPMTIGQTMQVVTNVLYDAFLPVIKVVGASASFIHKHWGAIEPVFWGLTAAVTAYKVSAFLAAHQTQFAAIKMAMYSATASGATGITWALKIASDALNTSLALNPIGWVVLAVGALVAALVLAIRHFDKFKLAWCHMVNAVFSYFEGWVNAYLQLLLWVIKGINLIAKTKIDTSGIEKVKNKLDSMRTARNEYIDQLKLEMKQKNKTEESVDYAKYISNIDRNTNSISGKITGLQDNLAYLVDVAEREVINKFTTAEVKIEQTNNNNIASDMDIDGVISKWNAGLEEALATTAEGVHA